MSWDANWDLRGRKFSILSLPPSGDFICESRLWIVRIIQRDWRHYALDIHVWGLWVSDGNALKWSSLSRKTFLSFILQASSLTSSRHSQTPPPLRHQMTTMPFLSELFATLLTFLIPRLMVISEKDCDEKPGMKTFPISTSDENFYDLFMFWLFLRLLCSCSLFDSLRYRNSCCWL